jgi:hypothetical protein
VEFESVKLTPKVVIINIHFVVLRVRISYWLSFPNYQYLYPVSLLDDLQEVGHRVQLSGRLDRKG